MTGAVTAGRIAKAMIRASEAPSSRAACTKSSCFAEITPLRTTREKIGTYASAIASTRLVVDRLRQPGELASREHPIVKIARLDPLRVEVFAPIALYGRIAVGQRAVVVPEAPLNRPLDATVVVVDRVADAASSTFGVRLEIANPGNRVPAALKCRVGLGEAGR